MWQQLDFSCRTFPFVCLFGRGGGLGGGDGGVFLFFCFFTTQEKCKWALNYCQESMRGNKVQSNLQWASIIWLNACSQSVLHLPKVHLNMIWGTGMVGVCEKGQTCPAVRGKQEGKCEEQQEELCEELSHFEHRGWTRRWGRFQLWGLEQGSPAACGDTRVEQIPHGQPHSSQGRWRIPKGAVLCGQDSHWGRENMSGEGNCCSLSTAPPGWGTASPQGWLLHPAVIAVRERIGQFSEEKSCPQTSLDNSNTNHQFLWSQISLCRKIQWRELG